MNLTINGNTVAIPDDWQNERLLFVLREFLGMTGTKYGCGAGDCGACTVIVEGEAQRSCLLTAGDVQDRPVRTIEGLARPDGALHPVQQAWLDHAVPQCGYCQAGQIMSAVALLDAEPAPTPTDIADAMDGNLCRCGTYTRIRKAVADAAVRMRGDA